MTNVYRLKSGDAAIWRDAVSQLVPEADREGELISIDEAEASLKDDRCYLLLATENEQSTGLLSAFRFPDVECGGALVYLYDIEVETTRRRAGIGKMLVNHLIELCDEDDVDLIWAGTESENKAARATFESTGAELDSDSYTEYEWELDQLARFLVGSYDTTCSSLTHL